MQAIVAREGTALRASVVSVGRADRGVIVWHDGERDTSWRDRCA